MLCEDNINISDWTPGKLCAGSHMPLMFYQASSHEYLIHIEEV